MNKENITLPNIEKFLCKLCRSIIEDFRSKNIKSNFFEFETNSFLTFSEQNINNFEELIKNFLRNIILKKIKRYYNDKNLENCKPKYTKVLDFMKKYSIDNPNSLEEKFNQEICTYVKNENILSNNDYDLNVINNNINMNNYNNLNKNKIDKNSPSTLKKIPEIKLPFKVIQMRNVNNENFLTSINNLQNNCNSKMVGVLLFL